MKKTKLFLGLVGILAIIMAVFLPKETVSAATSTGNVYTYTLGRHYAHPVTGVIEDSGGRAKYTTGQGMVEGCTYPTCMLEETDDGEYYVTIRMSLFDYTNGHYFWVQNKGDSGWRETVFGTTGSGSDTNGVTKDICIKVPSPDFVIRGKMHVNPMGRDVYWYMDLGGKQADGNTAGFNATLVTEPSVKNRVVQTEAPQTEAPTQASEPVPAESQLPNTESGSEQEKATQGNVENTPQVDGAVSKAQGIKLSTSKDKVSSPETGKTSGNSANTFLIYGLIIAGAAVGGFAIVMHIFLKNKKKLNRDYRDDDEN